MSRRRPVRIELPGCVVGFGKHAVKRMHERGLDAHAIAERLSARSDRRVHAGKQRFRGADGLVVVARRALDGWTVITAYLDRPRVPPRPSEAEPAAWASPAE